MSQLKSWRIYKEEDLFREKNMDDLSGPVGGVAVETKGRAQRSRKPPTWHNDYVLKKIIFILYFVPVEENRGAQKFCIIMYVLY